MSFTEGFLSILLTIVIVLGGVAALAQFLGQAFVAMFPF